MQTNPFLRLIPLLALALVAAPLAADSAGVSPRQLREQMRPVYQQMLTDVEYLAIKDQLRAAPRDSKVIERLLEYLPMSPMLALEIDMELNYYEFGIPRFIAEWHRRWIELHEQKARKMYGDAYVDGRLRTAWADDEAEAGVPTKATVGTNRNSAATFSPAPEDYQGEVQVVVNPNNTNQIVSAANTWDETCANGTQSVFYSSDGGVTWGHTCPPGDEGYSGMSCSGYVFGSDPALYWDDSGNVYLNYMLICYTGNYYYAMVVARSTNGGASWSGHGIIKNSWGTSDLEDKNFYIIDNNPSSPYYGRHYTCWDRNNNEKIAYSTNGGQSWTERDLPTTSGSGSGSRYDLGCEMAVEDDGTVHVIYDTLSCISSCNNEEMFYSRSTNGGVSWSTPLEVRDFNLVSFSSNSCPDAQDDRCINPFGSIDVDNTGGACDGYLYITFSDFTSGDGNNSDVWFTRSTNGGSSWSTPIVINDDGLSNRIQFHPFLVVDPTNGDIVVGWHDARNDSGNDAVDYFVARSTDCGASFEANVQVSQASSEFNNSTISYSNENSSDNPNYNPNQYGEYMGVDARGGKAYLAWSDTRHFFPSYTTESQAENVGFAVVDFGGECDDDPDCDDGLYCNGAETCVDHTCQAGTAIDCNDGVGCTDDSCNESTDSCDNVPNDALCANGLYCDGVETCHATLGCQVGTAIDCNDGVACTDDSCNESTDSCDNTPNHGACDNGLFCDGAEVCDPVLGCQAGSDPCPGLDCDEVNDQCIGGPEPQLEAGTVAVGATATTVNLTNTYVNPVVVATAQYAANTTPVVTRVSNVTAASFDLRLVNPSGGAVASDTVFYLVVEAGVWTIDGVAVEAQKYTSTVTDEAPSVWVGEAQSYGQSYTSPVVLGQVMSENDAWSVFWCQGGARTDPPSAAALTTGKTVCEDTDITRLDETVGIVVLEAGHGTLGGVEYEAALGADTVAGVGNAPPYTYTFNSAFATAPTIALMTMAGVDGNNGGWAQVHGSTVATTTSLYLSIDEDQITDTERSHTGEQVGYLAFAGPVVYPPAAECDDDPDCDDGLYCNGAETCVDSVCQAGTPVDCDDGVTCTDDSCNEGTDSCDNIPNDGNCNNGLYCDGVETCDAVLGCLAGTAVDCDDGVACTVDSCNEGTDSCDNIPDDGACDNGLFCDGAETCDPVLGCQAGSDPCPGLDCDEVNDECIGGTAAKLEWGTVSVGATAVTVNLSNTYTSPVVVTAVQYSSNTAPVVTRISNVTATSFDIRLQLAASGSPVAETVSYLVVEEGTWTVDGVTLEAWKYTSTVTDENNSWVGEAQSYGQSYTSPAVLGQVMSENDADWSVFWCRGSARANPPSASALTTGKTVCEDPDVPRLDETVGVVVFESGHGTLGGVEYEAALGADTVQGVTNSPPYSYTFNTAFATAPTVAVVTMAGVDGGNGGWAQVHGSTMATTTTLYLSIDEDQVGDTERNHITEQVGYVVFAGSGVYP